ncbi:MAG: histidine--tRNA ligase [Eubacteriales bacterium]|nr:histidine--tRNA ligase [Eubacteriales bacterium]
MKINAPKGTRDILPDESSAWQWLEQTFADICHLYAYQEIRVPTFEQTDLFQRGVGDTTDVVQKEMYTFDDKGGRSMTLRPEGTAGVVRSYLENGMASWPSPVRLFYNMTAFRYENVQKGRYREFHQFGCEAFSAAGPEIDAELISLIDLFFQRLGLSQTSLQINSIGCPVCRTAYHTQLRAWLQPRVASLCPTCQGRFEKNPLRILDCKEERCQQATAEAPLLIDHLCPDCDTHFEALKNELTLLDLPFCVNPRIVRGLDYYTRTVFEFISDHVGTQGTICGGGRYDGLIETMGGPATPGIGFALGVERLLMELQAQGVKLPGPETADLYLAAAGSAGPQVRRLSRQMRQAGIRAETDLTGRSLKAQIKYAARRGIRFLLVIGDDELNRKSARLRRLSDGSESDVSLDDLRQLMELTQHNKQEA